MSVPSPEDTAPAGTSSSQAPPWQRELILTKQKGPGRSNDGNSKENLMSPMLLTLDCPTNSDANIPLLNTPLTMYITDSSFHDMNLLTFPVPSRSQLRACCTMCFHLTAASIAYVTISCMCPFRHMRLA